MILDTTKDLQNITWELAGRLLILGHVQWETVK
jgi:hypothetical protein